MTLLGRLVRQKESPAASSFASGIANILQPSELRFISERQAELIPVLLSHRPALAFDAETWQLPGHTQSQIYEALSRLPLNQDDWAKILGAMFIAATDVAVREVVEKAGPHAMQGAFRWLDHGIAQDLLPSEPWRDALSVPAETLLSKEQMPPGPLALCAWCLPRAAARRVLSASRQDIQELASQSLEVLPRPLRVPTSFLLVTLGLLSESEVGVKLLVNSFFTVHDALGSGDYSSDSWLLLSPELPYLGWWNWDRCEKLRRATCDWLSHHVQSGNPLLKAALTPQHRELSKRVYAGDSHTGDFID